MRKGRCFPPPAGIRNMDIRRPASGRLCAPPKAQRSVLQAPT
ncbi:hypothetical protein BDD41_4046 [Paracoccus versutus]|uniref:Uncharacterized protein n=1 Tax=Paracoccus versutus TaxID=34007 RepID=A0A3D9XPZ6_PARVE|nr:hypothetical protein BDD41_4046 [Paracoccus versutus]